MEGARIMERVFDVIINNYIYTFNNYNDASIFMDLALDGGALLENVEINIYYRERSEENETES